MNVTEHDIEGLHAELDQAVDEAEAYFRRVWKAIEQAGNTEKFKMSVSPNLISDEDTETVVPALSRRLSQLILKVIETSKSSPLVSEVDHADARIALKKMLAALRFHQYHHWQTHVLNDEDRILGVGPGGQREDTCSFTDAHKEFREAAIEVKRIVGLIFPSDTPVATALVRSEVPGVKKYRANTAFIMMWISKEHPELEDVNNCFKETFRQFGITAVRSDEIEHSDKITDRILDEIATAEFLIADLTGERTSVYYEVGYAHALGKRPILFRKANTHLGFDLAGHNCPEYENLIDLRARLTARLEALTNRKAGERAR